MCAPCAVHSKTACQGSFHKEIDSGSRQITNLTTTHIAHGVISLVYERQFGSGQPARPGELSLAALLPAQSARLGGRRATPSQSVLGGGAVRAARVPPHHPVTSHCAQTPPAARRGAVAAAAIADRTRPNRRAASEPSAARQGARSAAQMRVIHNNLRAGEQPPSLMDKLRNNFNHLCPPLRARYRKLFDEYTSSKENIPLLIQGQDYVYHSCACCGRTQKLQAEELNAVVGNAFRLAYAARLQRSCRGQPTGESTSCCTTESHPTADKANNRTWGRRSRQREPGRRELCRGKSVNVASGSSEPETTARLAPELRRSLLTGYVNEAVSVTDSESRSSESDGRPLSAAGRSVSESSQSLRDDAKSCHWSSASSSASTSHVDGVSGASTPTPPPYYQQGPSAESLQLRTAAWFQAGIPREIALEVLSQEPVGAFMVRESTTKHGCYALSLRVPRDFQVSGIAHYLILNTTKGYKIKGFTKEFTSLTALITHHSVMPELLPCTLSLSRYNPDFARVESSDLVELDADSEYNGLSQLSQATSDTSV